eukprot:2373197-Ditylum_brightwellii.AAC.1
MKYENFQGFLERAIQLVTTKKPQIMFEVTGNVDKRWGAQPDEENSPIYSLTVEVFELGSPKEWLLFKHQVKQQAMFKEEIADNLEHYLNAVTVYVFLNKTYKVQK